MFTHCVAGKQKRKLEEKELQVLFPDEDAIETHSNSLSFAIVSGDGKLLVTGHSNPPVTRVFNVQAKRPLLVLHRHFKTAFFTSSQSHVFLGQTEGGYWIIDALTGEEKAHLSIEPSEVFSTASSIDGKSILFCSEEHPCDLQSWDWQTGKVRSLSFRGENTGDEVYNGAISPDGTNLVINRLLSATSFVSPSEYTPKSIAIDKDQPAHKKDKVVDVSWHVSAVSYSPNGKWFSVTTDDGTSWFDADAVAAGHFSLDDYQHNTVFTEDGLRFVTWSNERLSVVDVVTGKELRSRAICNASVAPGGRFAVCILGNRMNVFEV